MNQPVPPVLTIRHDGSQRTFAAGNDVVIGRDLRADLRIADQRISRRHLILRFDQGRWLAIDTGSVNGTYLNGSRMPVIVIHDGQSINVGNAQGPQLTFEVGRRPARAGRPPRSGLAQKAAAPTRSWSAPPAPAPPEAQNPPPPSLSGNAQRPRTPSGLAPSSNMPPPTEMTVISAGCADVPNLATRMVKFFSPRSTALSVFGAGLVRWKIRLRR